ncbi:SLC13 family permease [Cellulomonas sp. P22]|uniref:SLC13 family permease n=1 Tax=Cellulomonas sp. P22 TaxID=3373189 RepID=UPI0037A6F2A8
MRLPGGRRLPWWVLAVLVVVGVVGTGVLPLPDARELVTRTFPVLLFVAALTVVAELCAAAGLFDAAAGFAARVARGRRTRLWLLVVGIAVVSTVVLSLDTTAVLLTPAVIALGRRTGFSTRVLALAVLALANTASLLLPVSNLTNLLADHVLRTQGVGYVALMWAPALAAIVMTVVYLAVRDRGDLRGTFVTLPAPAAPDAVLLRTTALVTAALGVAFAAGVPVTVVAVVAALVLLVVTRVRRGELPGPVGRMVPWQMLLVVLALFTVVEAAHVHGLGELLARVAGTGDGPGALLRLAATGAVGANAADNLPAYLALEPTAGGEPLRLAALLIGVGVGPLVTPWGSLATLLWLQRCRQMLMPVSPWTVVRQGAVLAPLAVLAAVGALVATH